MARVLNDTDFGDFARKLYALDPDYTWDNRQVQHFISFDDLSGQRKLELIHAARGFASFINAFERDVPVQALAKLTPLISVHGAGLDLSA